ncbi:MAG: hypothetical protein H6851_20505 [Geminicoccaceae bacterium]|nr:hypothetical protein [Geminicoccaceae bacterium]
MIVQGSDLALQDMIDRAAARSRHFLESLQARKNYPEGVMLFDRGQDVARWPGMLLPGTYNGIMCLDLLGALADWPGPLRLSVANWLLSHRCASGVFRIEGMTDDAVYKRPALEDTWAYIDFHVTNYTLGALQALAPEDRPVLDFVRPWLDPVWLKAWLAERDLRDPWLEGNNIVNLASFLGLLKEEGDPLTVGRVREAFAVLFDWHDRLQEPSTGFWGVGQMQGGERLLHAMAGSMHNFHIWYACGRQLAYQDRAVDYVLSREPVWHSACIDVDEVDLLVHAAQGSPYRSDEIAAWLQRKLEALLENQNSDGGYPDTLDKPWRQDGWVHGPVIQPGVSTTFATWFRWIAIAMIDGHLWPGRRNWRFRRMIGIGYKRTVGHD